MYLQKSKKDTITVQNAVKKNKKTTGMEERIQLTSPD